MMLAQVGSSTLLILTRMIYYANYTKSFYIYTLSSQLFRSLFIHRLKFSIRQIPGQHAPVLLLDLSGTNNEGTVGAQNRQAP